MVWSMSYRPRPDSYPLAEVHEGNSGELELEDMSDDGGRGLKMSRSQSGRRVKPESVPKVLRWMSKRKLLDYETSRRKTVSDRFRALIEALEPGVHQFEPIRYIAKDKTPLEDRWFWQICNRLDSVHREKTTMVFGNVTWQVPPKPTVPTIVFDLVKVNDAQFWYDKHLSAGLYISNAAKTAIETGGITGVHFKHYDQA